MLTKWAKKNCAILNYQDGGLQFVPCSFSASGPAMIEAKTLNGTVVYIPPKVDGSGSGANPFYYITGALVQSGTSASVGVAFGSGNTPATENDYNLEHIITGLTVSANPSVQAYCDKTNWKYHARLDYAVSNNTGEAVTISEIGMFRRFYTSTTRGNDASSSARCSILIDRTVLAQPITIPNGSAATVRYEFVYDA